MRAVEFLVEKPVESSWIVDLRFNRPKKILTMHLSNGRAFTIPNITRTTFERWTNAPSKGRFFHTNIKDRYQVNRIK